MDNILNNIIIDLNYAKKQRESIVSNKEFNNNINNQLEIFSVPIKVIIDLHIDLSHIALILDEDLNNKYTRDVILSGLTMILNRMSDIAIILDINLIAEVQEIEIKDLEIILNSLFNNVSRLNDKKSIARLVMKKGIIPLFADLVYSLGFNLNDLKEYHYKQYNYKDTDDILEFKNEINKIIDTFNNSEVIRAVNIVLDEMIEKQQYEDFKRSLNQNKYSLI